MSELNKFDKYKKEPFPMVSMIVVVRNEAKYIKKCLTSLIQQDYPKSRYEIIVVDGMSTDGTRDIIQQIAKTEKRIRLFNNPKLILASGWNIGIKKAKGDIVIRIDAHAFVTSDFISESVKYLKKEDAVCVGGPHAGIIGEGYIGKSISCLLSSPFGVGNAKYRYGCKEGYVDTVPYGAYWKKIFEEIGFFNEDLVRNQDIEFHSRIRKKGWKIFMAPSIRSYYYCRSNIRGLLKQSFGNGYWVIETLTSASLRHLVPLFFVISILIFSLLSLFSLKIRMLFIILLGTYFSLALSFTLYSIIKRDVKHSLLLPVLFFLFHISYGLGSLYNCLKKVSFLINLFFKGIFKK